MTFHAILQHYYEIKSHALVGKTFYTKPGVRAYPEVHRGVALFKKVLSQVDLSGTLVDATGSAGAVALVAPASVEKRVVLEPSRAALSCARKTFSDDAGVTLAAGAPWNMSPASADTVCLIPATDRGNARVQAELLGAYRALKAGGSFYFVTSKNEGAKRYEKGAKALFGELEVLAKQGGWRLAQVRKGHSETREVELVDFEAAGLTLSAEPGVYAAGKLDPGTAVLLDTFEFESLAGKRVLDLGCGYGLIALKASLAGATVTALDDDLTAVRSTHRNAKTYGLDVRCLHSDVTSELRSTDTFDAVIMNPPFHVGKGVRLELPRAFIAAAHKHLAPGGELVLVANKALAYEELLARFAYWETLQAGDRFKVLRGLK